MKKFFKKYWILIILATLLILIVFLKISSKKEQSISNVSQSITPTISSVSTPKNSWNGITPGITTKSEVLQKLGTPTSTKEENNLEVLLFPPEQDNSLVTVGINKTDSLVSYVKRLIPNEKYSDLINKFKDTKSFSLYGPESVNNYNATVWLEYGVALIANKEIGAVLEIWYFKPISINEFQSTLGKDLSNQPVRQF